MSRTNLYIVYAGSGNNCTPVYRTPKKQKAERYLHAVVMKQERYTKAYIECVHRRSDDKRSRWKEVD